MTNESQTRSEEMQEKAEAMVLAVLKSADYPAAARTMSDALGLPALLTAEAELSHVDAVLARRPALADEPDRRAKIEKAINVAKQVDQLRAELESTNMALKASCQCAEQFKAERDELLKLLDSVCIIFPNPPSARQLPHLVHDLNKQFLQLRAELDRTTDHTREEQRLEIERLRAELAQLRRNVATLYEWIQSNTSLTGKQKDAANYIFEQLDKGVREDSDLRAKLATQGRNAVSLFDECKKLQTELAAAKAENAALRDVAKALRRVRTLCGIRSEPYIPHYVRMEIEKIMDDALHTLAEKGVVLDERKD